MSDHFFIPEPAVSQAGARMRETLAERGAILIRETRPIASVLTIHGRRLVIAAHIVVAARKGERAISAGIQLEQEATTRQNAATAFVDEDELEELLAAFTFVIGSAEQMAHDDRDYTEVTYLTRDGVTIGFFQQARKQQALVRLGAIEDVLLFSTDILNVIQRGIAQAQEHAQSRLSAWRAK